MTTISKIIIIITFFYVSIGSAQDEAGVGESSLGLTLNNYFDIYTYWGTGSSELGTEDENPNLNQYGVGFTWAVNSSGFLAGLGMEYRYIDHAKDFVANVGSFKGERFVPVYLMIGMVSDPFVIKLDYQFTGDYVLENLTVSDARVIYRNPGGYRLTVLYKIWSKLQFGVHYESLRFRDRLDTKNGQQVLTEGFSLNNISFAMAYGF